VNISTFFDLSSREVGEGEIVEQAEAIEAEMVVIGCARNTRRSAQAAIFGATIQEILKKTSCRVMVIASPPKAQPWTVSSSLGTTQVSHVPLSGSRARNY
jgi:Universal stress protein family